jgi:hypothetical protein
VRVQEEQVWWEVEPGFDDGEGEEGEEDSEGGLSGMIVEFPKQMHLQKDVAGGKERLSGGEGAIGAGEGDRAYRLRGLSRREEESGRG